MRWFLTVLGVSFGIVVFLFLDYSLPSRQTVRITNTYNRLTDIGANRIFYASPDTGTVQNAQGQRDVRFIDTVRPNGRPYVYRNEDTGWIWPPYFKYDSSNLHAKATDLKSTAANPEWVSITSYGWRVAWLSIYPNAISIKPVSGPQDRPFNWPAAIILLLLGALLALIWRMWNQFRERTIDPAVRSADQTWDRIDARADAARDHIAAEAAQARGRVGRWWSGLWGAAVMARANPGTDFRPDWFQSMAVNTPAAERRAASLPARRSLKREWQAAWLLNAVRCIDLTTLSGDDTPDRVARLCAKARQPVDAGQLQAMGVQALTTGAVCVYPTMVGAAKRALQGSGVPVASVATGFPAGLMPLDLRLAEIRYALDQGADEIDIVISRALVLRGEWAALYDEIRAMREACGPALMKAILATGELKTLTNVARASHVAMQAGADFIKTSTGKEPVNATLPVSLVMLRAIRDYREQTGFAVGFKPAGGLRTARDALNWQVLMAEELGRDWLRPQLFRIGASSLLADIERQISHHVTGRYASAHRLAAG